MWKNSIDIVDNVILVLSFIAILFPDYSFPTAFSTAFVYYYIDPQTNTITPVPGRNTVDQTQDWVPYT